MEMGKRIPLGEDTFRKLKAMVVVFGAEIAKTDGFYIAPAGVTILMRSAYNEQIVTAISKQFFPSDDVHVGDLLLFKDYPELLKEDDRGN